MQSFEIIDYVFIVILLLSTLFGFARGFLREAFTLLNISLASLATYFLYPHSYEFFAGSIKSESIVKFLSVAVFVPIWILVAIINSFVIDALKSSRGTLFDRLMGTAFGLMRGMMIVVCIYVGLVIGAKSNDEEGKLPEFLAKAKTQNFVRMQSEYALKFAPDNIRKAYYEGGKGVLKEMVESLGRDGPVSEAERMISDLGLKYKDIKTLREIVEQVPYSYDRSLEFADLAKMKKDDFLKYSKDLIRDYNAGVAEGRIAATIPEARIESLSKVLDDIENGVIPEKSSEEPALEKEL